MKMMAGYQTEQKKKLAAREDFNNKYTEINKTIALELKKEREEKEKRLIPAPDPEDENFNLGSTPPADFISVDLTHAELIELVSSVGMEITNPFLTEKIFDYVIKKNHDSGHR